MFDLQDRLATCDGTSRRSFLRVGGLSLFGLSLPGVLAQHRALAAAEAARSSDVNCIVIFTDGGMSNIDTLDMKPRAPAEYRGEFQPIATNVPGMEICEHMPRMAQQMDKVCVIRSIAHKESGDHMAARHYMLTGYPQRPDITGQPVGSTVYPSFGSVVTRELGWRNNLPPYVLFGGLDYSGAGYMGATYNPLQIQADPAAADFRVENVSIPTSVGAERTERRRQMLARLDAWQRRVERGNSAVAVRGEFYEQAFDLITSPAAKQAFKLDDESAELRDRYGRTREGQCCLLARRLVEAGVRFVTISSGGWDTHANNFSSLRDRLLPTLDQAWSALLQDLSDRGMLSNTLVICTGEFGRTPGVNGAAGRDHYAPCNAVGFSGAGVQMGRTVGQTDDKCMQVVGTPHGTLDYAATVYRILGIDPHREYITDDGRPVAVNHGGVPMAEVLA
jgi:hypothetical protein